MRLKYEPASLQQHISTVLRLCPAGRGVYGACNWGAAASGLRIWEGFGFRVDGFGTKGQGLGLGVGVDGLGVRDQGLELRLRVSEGEGSAELPDKARSSVLVRLTPGRPAS